MAYSPYLRTYLLIAAFAYCNRPQQLHIALDFFARMPYIKVQSLAKGATHV